MKRFLIIFLQFIAIQAWSEAESAALPQEQKSIIEKPNAKSSPLNIPIKKTLVLDYHSWFENLNFLESAGAVSNVVSVLYGFSLNYDITKYYEKWGLGGHLGYGQGYAVGDGETSTYLQKRVPWNYLRFGGRVFSRLNGRTDMGLSLLMMKKSMSWPESGGTVQPGPTPAFSLFLEIRWRMTKQWEMIQALGNSTKNAGANLRFGFGYTF